MTGGIHLDHHSILAEAHESPHVTDAEAATLANLDPALIDAIIVEVASRNDGFWQFYDGVRSTTIDRLLARGAWA